MGDEPDNKKTDKVISMADFSNTARRVEEVEGVEKVVDSLNSVTAQSVLWEASQNTSLVSAVVLGQSKEGNFFFTSSIYSVAEIVLLLEAYKKILLDSIVGNSHDE